MAGLQAPTDEHSPKPSAAAAGGPGGAGAPGDALGPLADALLASARTAGAEPAGDPRARASLQLGWLMDDILAGRPDAPLPDLEAAAAAGFLAQAHRLTTLVGVLKIDGLIPASVVDVLAKGVQATSQASAWQPAVVAALFGADGRFAKAYDVGRRLNGLGHVTGDARVFEQPAIAGLLAELDDLTTVLPPHAGRAVANSVRRWVALGKLPSDPAILPAQCGLWRTILAGEKSGTELLEPENYLDAADRLGGKLHATVTAALRRLRWLVLAIVALFVAGVVVLTVGPARGTITAAGLSGVLVAAGLTWKGIGGAVGQLIGKLEAPLWRAELDGAITDAITLVKQGPPVVSVRARRDAATTGDYAGRASRAAGRVTP